ncbi:bifunctional 5,10-methylenetetrahydrofolate dehydrogenase/5,10-methenyltetrahydrofolate cyclohydrolase [bacterium]|nr:bifunctional 5,10-methylenetetrahydrofolate dehydrogenase/5,10-methenyltetrahydrofolate cyclohydrolase [bacterium]
MQTEIFDGRAKSREILAEVARRVAQWAAPVRMVDIFWQEDPSSVFYARYKQRRAREVGIDFEARPHSFAEPVASLQEELYQENLQKNANGIMLQKPTKKCYIDYFLSTGKQPRVSFDQWWKTLVTTIRPRHDVDGLLPSWRDEWRAGRPATIMPATMAAVRESVAKFELQGKKILIIGRSDILGEPLSVYWQAQNYDVTLVGKAGLAQVLAQAGSLQQYDVIVSAVGKPGLITGSMIKCGSILVDVGEPKADFDIKSCTGKAAFVTPVPGGIGPMTVACLLRNCLILRELDE